MYIKYCYGLGSQYKHRDVVNCENFLAVILPSSFFHSLIAFCLSSCVLPLSDILGQCWTDLCVMLASRISAFCPLHLIPYSLFHRIERVYVLLVCACWHFTVSQHSLACSPVHYVRVSDLRTVGIAERVDVKDDGEEGRLIWGFCMQIGRLEPTRHRTWGGSILLLSWFSGR